ncbi:MAG: MTH938/NDUFAF3 family protein [bacterium]|nr:MTH938/NDUFAF3 family protein [bacterium]
MKIKAYSFGKIKIDDTEYNSDIIILKDTVISNWWRKEGHKLFISDIEKIFNEEDPEILIIGTGAYGVLTVEKETIDFLNNKGIEFKILKTGAAVDYYNQHSEEKLIFAALHLTC